MAYAPLPTVSIRDYRTGDAPHLHRIDQICFASDIAFSRGELLFNLNHTDSVCSVAERVGEIVGFALGRVHSRHQAHVVTLDVLPEVRRQGIGTTLMDSLHAKFLDKKVSLSVLEVSTENLSAQGLYLALGYEVVETVKGYYNGREDAFRMIRIL